MLVPPPKLRYLPGRQNAEGSNFSIVNKQIQSFLFYCFLIMVKKEEQLLNSQKQKNAPSFHPLIIHAAI